MKPGRGITAQEKVLTFAIPAKQESMMTNTILLRSELFWMWLWSKIVVNMWRMASEVLLSTNISVSMSTVTFEVNIHFFVGHVCCLGILSAILKNNKLRFFIRLKNGVLRTNASTWQVRTTSFIFTWAWIPFVLFGGNILHNPQINCLKGWVRLWLFEGKSGAYEQLI